MTYEDVRKQLLSKVRQKVHNDHHRLQWTREQILEYQQTQYQKLIRHVLHHSLYYRMRCKKARKLTDIKPTTKQEVMENWDDIICIPGLSKNSAEAYLTQFRNGELDNPFFKDYYYITATGGSSGLRGLFIWDLDYFAEVGYAAFRYQYQDELKKPIQGPKKVAALTAPSLIHASTPLFTLTLDDETEMQHFSVELNIDELCQRLNEFQPTHLIGYSSVITELAHRANAGQLKISPQRVSTNSEPLASESREIVRKVWGIEINNMWGSVEMGMAGIENDDHCGLFLSDDLLIIEPVDENLKPVDNAKAAKKLLITNLFNLTFPLIRYVVDDIVDIEDTTRSGYRIAKDISGRADTWFAYSKNLKIHPMVFRNVLGQEAAITEYQVEQTPQGATIRVVLNADVDLNKIMDQIISALKNAGLQTPVVDIQQVKELPRILETGKLKHFIPLSS